MSATTKKTVSTIKQNFCLNPVFSNDGGFLYNVRGDALYKYNAVTGSVVAISQPQKYKILAISIVQNGGSSKLLDSPSNLLISLDDRGTATSFCTETLNLLSNTVEISKLSSATSLPNATPRCACFIAVGVQEDAISRHNKRHLPVYRIDVAVNRSRQLMISRKQMFTVPASSTLKLVVSAGAEMVLIFGGKAALLWSASGQLLRRLPSSSKITASCFSIRGDVLATGHSNGVIRLWHLVEVKDKGLVPSTMLHWHSSEVACLSFTEQGRVLLSGAGEGVLVSWQVETGRKNFLPRLGAPLRTISVSLDASAVQLADNSIAVVDSQFSSVKCRMRALFLDAGVRFVFLDGLKSRIFCDGPNGAIQFYGFFF